MSYTFRDVKVVKGLPWLKLRHRLIHGGDGFAVFHLEDGILRCQEGFTPELFQEVHQGYKAKCQANDYLKRDVRRNVVKVSVGGRNYVVKGFLELHSPQCFSPEYRSWLGSYRLSGGAECYCMFRSRSEEFALLVFEDVGSEDLYAINGSIGKVEEMPDAYVAAGKLLGRLHLENVYHGDTKSGNFVVSSNGSESLVTLIDCDDVRVYCRLSQRRRIKNLAQFLGCLFCLSSDELRGLCASAFLRGYSSVVPGGESWVEANSDAIRRQMDKLYPDRLSCNDELSKRIFPKKPI